MWKRQYILGFGIFLRLSMAGESFLVYILVGETIFYAKYHGWLILYHSNWVVERAVVFY
jgi:hypothetical protein